MKIINKLLAVIRRGLFNGDRVLNYLLGGNIKVTISARTAYLANKKSRVAFKLLEEIIDAAFYPVDGKYHCYRAYNSQKEHGIKMGPVWSRVLLFIVGAVSSIPIAVVLWSCWLVYRVVQYIAMIIVMLVYYRGDKF